jgi:hypothetical protein
VNLWRTGLLDQHRAIAALLVLAIAARLALWLAARQFKLSRESAAG